MGSSALSGPGQALYPISLPCSHCWEQHSWEDTQELVPLWFGLDWPLSLEWPLRAQEPENRGSCWALVWHWPEMKRNQPGCSQVRSLGKSHLYMSQPLGHCLGTKLVLCGGCSLRWPFNPSCTLCRACIGASQMLLCCWCYSPAQTYQEHSLHCGSIPALPKKSLSF